jgi:CO/xanthine dehydrogenase FAD-binding subunit
MMNTTCEILIPKSLNEALQMLSDQKRDTKILAGGTDIVTGIKQESKRFVNTELLIDVNRIPELKEIKEENGKIVIGAASTFTDLCKSKLITEKLPILKKAANTVGSLQIRNRATIAGNFVNNAPCADTVPALLIYNAFLEIESMSAMKEISLQEFLQGPYKTQLKPDELVTKIKIQIPSENCVGDFYKLGRRRAVAISRLTLAVMMNLDENKVKDILIASGAVTPIGTRFPKLEQFAYGKLLNDNLCKELAKKMGEEVLAVTGLRWSSAYKLPVAQQMFFQLLMNIKTI